MKRGFTLVEVIIVTAIIGILSLISFETVTSFQKTSSVESLANEFASALKTAKSKSIAGEVQTGVTYDPGFPKFEIKINTGDYEINRIDSDVSIKNLETLPIASNLSITPTGNVIFSRLYGDTPDITFTIKSTDNKEKRTVQIINSIILLKRI